MKSFGDIFWQAFLVNFLFWSALAQGSVILIAVLDITRARWGRQYIQIARGFAGFLPVSILMMAVLLLGRNSIFPWIAEPIPEKAAYLNITFLAARDLIGLAILATLSWIFLSRVNDSHAGSSISDRHPRSGASPWSVALVIAFMSIYSYLAFDLIMSLQPHWHSTLLGAHYAVSSFYLGIAGLVFTACFRADIAREERGHLSKLLFGVSPFWISLLWSQYIVIWYGDIPEETGFVYLRFYHAPWTTISIAVIVLAWVLPFIILMPRRAKLMGALQLLASACAIVGLMLERHMLVVPSLSPDKVAFGWIHLLVTVLFAVLFVVCYRFSARRTRKPERLSAVTN